jgi:hypothetical protein
MVVSVSDFQDNLDTNTKVAQRRLLLRVAGPGNGVKFLSKIFVNSILLRTSFLQKRYTFHTIVFKVLRKRPTLSHPELTRGKATSFRLFDSDESKTVCFLASSQIYKKHPQGVLFVYLLRGPESNRGLEVMRTTITFVT